MRDLYFLHNDNGSYTDYSIESRDYLRDSFNISYVAAEDEILIGLYKPFYSLYFEIETAALTGNLTAEYSTAASFSSLEITDHTKSFQRSGFLKWQRENELWEAQTIDGKELYWIKLKLDADNTVGFVGANIVFSDDNDLKAEQRNIDRLLAKGDSSFIAYHVSARDEIIQSLRNSGDATIKEGNVQMKNLTKWDLLDVDEVRQASKYLTLAKINFDVSSEVDDKYHQRYRDLMSQYGTAFKLFYKSIDTDDDGVKDNNEGLKIRTIELYKV